MKTRPILFSAPMVRALLDGTKTQTRRLVKPQPEPEASLGFLIPQPNAKGSCAHFHKIDARGIHSDELTVHCPYGMPGDRLWVRETAIITPPNWTDRSFSTHPDAPGGPRCVQYLATNPETEAAEDYKLKKTPSIFMPRWASRITLEIVSVRVERLQDISEDDARAEGAQWAACGAPQEGSHKAGYALLWESLNGAGSWPANPWVWCVEFKRIEA